MSEYLISHGLWIATVLATVILAPSVLSRSRPVGIAAAERSIRIATYVLGSDEAGRAILAALTAKARAGVEVRVLLDDLLVFRAPKGDLAGLVAAGGRWARFMPLVHLPFRGRSNL